MNRKTVLMVTIEVMITFTPWVVILLGAFDANLWSWLTTPGEPYKDPDIPVTPNGTINYVHPLPPITLFSFLPVVIAFLFLLIDVLKDEPPQKNSRSRMKRHRKLSREFGRTRKKGEAKQKKWLETELRNGK